MLSSSVNEPELIFLVCSPESMGLVCACVYILALILFIPFAFSTPIRMRANGSISQLKQEGITVVEFPHYQVCHLFLLSFLEVHHTIQSLQSISQVSSPS